MKLVLGRTTFAMLAGMAPATPKIDTAVCDLRVPFSWFVGETRSNFYFYFIRLFDFITSLTVLKYVFSKRNV